MFVKLSQEKKINDLDFLFINTFKHAREKVIYWNAQSVFDKKKSINPHLSTHST